MKTRLAIILGTPGFLQGFVIRQTVPTNPMNWFGIELLINKIPSFITPIKKSTGVYSQYFFTSKVKRPTNTIK